MDVHALAMLLGRLRGNVLINKMTTPHPVQFKADVLTDDVEHGNRLTQGGGDAAPPYSVKMYIGTKLGGRYCVSNLDKEMRTQAGHAVRRTDSRWILRDGSKTGKTINSVER